MDIRNPRSGEGVKLPLSLPQQIFNSGEILLVNRKMILKFPSSKQKDWRELPHPRKSDFQTYLANILKFSRVS